MTFKIREATKADMPRIVKMTADAFLEENIFGQLMHPYRYEHRDDYEFYFLCRQRANWWDYNHTLLVATVQEVIDGKEQEYIVGVGEWEKQGNQAWAIPWWDPRWMMKPAMTKWNVFAKWWWPSKASNKDPKYADPFFASFPFFSHHWAGARENNWYLDLLCVDKDYMRRGIGGALIAWGVERAHKEGVCASLVSSAMAQSLYARSGFTELSGFCTEGEGNPMAGCKGGAIMFTPVPGKQAPEAATATTTTTTETVKAGDKVVVSKTSTTTSSKSAVVSKSPTVTVQEVTAEVM